VTDTTMKPLTFGLSLPNRAVLFGIPSELLFETARDAEKSGKFDSLWVGDNFLSKPRLESVTLLTALATTTERLKLGTICMASFPLRNPLLLALQWATLDIISNGRTQLVVCNGGAASWGTAFSNELKLSGVKSIERVGRVEEGIQVLRQAFSPNPVNFHGKYYDFDNIDVQPKPIQEHVPIGIAVNPHTPVEPDVEERFLRRVARYADAWQTDACDPELFKRRWAMIQAFSAEEGRPGAVRDAQLHLMVNINEDAAAARQEAVTFLNHYYGEGTIGEQQLSNWLAFGSPEAVIDKIGTFVDAGYTTIVLRFTAEDQRGQLERCITDVLPAFDTAAAASGRA
jgi:alkanesulfonate monooxygenase SsuD/methylene tetrahydromethanopterin reductase-like flavin-dependent oxidoreductase (luciferase family)